MSPLLHNRPQSPVNNHIGGKGSPSPVAQASPDVQKPGAINKHPGFHNNMLSSDDAENHLDEQLSTDDFMDSSDQFETLSQVSLNSLESAEDSTEDGETDAFGSDNSDLFIGSSKEPGDLENCFGNDTTAFAHKMRKLRPCRSYEEVNVELRSRIVKEIRKPGRKYEIIFALLKDVQGSLETRLLFLQNVIKEAARFKKRMLIEQLEGFLEEIHKRANNVNHYNSC